MITRKQIAALKYMIFNARDVDKLSKQLLAFLIDRSKKLTNEVCLTLVENRNGYTADEINAIANGVGWMCSSNGTTHLDQIFHVMGSKLHFSFHYGDFNPRRKDNPFSSAGQFAGVDECRVTNPELVRKGMPLRYTFWLSKKYYSRQARLVVAKRKNIEKIDIEKPGLYPALESHLNQVE